MVRLSHLLSSYANHIVYGSLYSGLAAWCTKIIVISQRSRKTTHGGSLFTEIAGIIGGTVSVCCLYYELLFAWRRRNLPFGDSGLPLIGHVLQLFVDPMDVLMLPRMKKYGSMFTMNFFMTPTVVAGDEESASWLVSLERKGLSVPPPTPILVKVLGESNVLLQSGAVHKRLRRIMDPLFTPKAIRQYTSIIDTTVKTELEKWSNTDEYYKSSHFSHLTLRVFFVCSLGFCDEKLFHEMSPLFEAWINGLFTLSTYEIPGTIISKSMRSKRRLYEIFIQMIQEYKGGSDANLSIDRNKSLLAQLCNATDEESGAKLPDEQLVENLLLIVFAGHDTTKASLSTIIHLLEQNPSVLSALREEVSLLSDPFDFDELKSAPILNAVLAESWRLHPVVVQHLGQLTKSVEFKGYRFPKGTVMSLPLFVRDGTYVNPREFRIERWLPKDHPMYDPAWIPRNNDPINYNSSSALFRTFNLGPHSCLGAQFARLETRIIVARLVSQFEFKTRKSKLIAFPLRRIDCEFKLTPRFRLD